MEADTVVLMITIVGSVLGSTLTTIGLLMSEIRGLRDKFDDLAERVARIEGYLMPSGGFALQRPEPPPDSQPSAADQLPLGGQPSAADQPPPAAAS
ncbi:MAG: hypothetical protein F4Z00_04015 [Acidimicrobiaceae bacterium]|nr:hypothetical protein [Acidimicrobiaceae bacterium]MXZ64698.1 hypothetical protein [Acidimicrobiaceae bacterium]